MSLNLGTNPQVQIKPAKPVCDACGSENTAPYKTQGAGLTLYRGVQCRRSKQYRKCRECDGTFPVVVIQAPRRKA